MSAVMLPDVHEVSSSTPSDLLRIAVQQGADLDRLERLMALQERWEANEARKRFTEAMTAFKAEPLVIFKKKEVDFPTAKGRTHYMHAELSDVTDVICPALARHQLSHRWTVSQEGGGITVSCIVTHVAGHSEAVTMTAKADDSGGKNAIQAIASAVSYLQRYTLLGVCGVSTKGMDDDGQGAAGGQDGGQGGDEKVPLTPNEKRAWANAKEAYKRDGNLVAVLKRKTMTEAHQTQLIAEAEGRA